MEIELDPRYRNYWLDLAREEQRKEKEKQEEKRKQEILRLLAAITDKAVKS